MSSTERIRSIRGVSDETLLRIIGRNVAAARLRANLTQECLAELVGVHAKTIGSIERGKYPFGVTTLVRLAQHLETSANRLIEGAPPPNAKQAARIRKALPRRRQSKTAT